MQRRTFLARSGLALGAAVIATPHAALAQSRGLGESSAPPAPPSAGTSSLDDWEAVRAQFALDPDLIHMSGFYLASHPAPVREAIERHRRALDANPIGYQHPHVGERDAAVVSAAGNYLGVRAHDIALTDSTTMGLALMYGNIKLSEGQDILTTTHDHYSTRTSLHYRAERTGAKVREMALYQKSAEASVDAIVGAITKAITTTTRILAVTWVHSGTGVKLPLKAIAAALADINKTRDAKDRVILCVDGVHGLGVDDINLPDLGCDFFAAGTHKWMFGPRGTGILWARPEAQDLLSPFIPSFIPSFGGGMVLRPNGQPAWGAMNTPGGFHSFEHRWALDEAFKFHQRIGKQRVADRIHQLNRQLKEGLVAMKHVTLHTPLSDELSAGIVCFEVAAMTPPEVVERLAAKKIVASVSPYAVSYARLAPSLLVNPKQVDIALREVRALA